MKKYEFMAEKYPLFNNDPKEAEFPIPEGYECFRVCRYGDGYVYRVLKELTDTEKGDLAKKKQELNDLRVRKDAIVSGKRAPEFIATALYEA